MIYYSVIIPILILLYTPIKIESDIIHANSRRLLTSSHFTTDSENIITTGADATDIYGGIVTLAANSTVDAFNGISKITVDGSVAQTCEGLKMSLVCDGVNWHLSGHIATAVGTVHLVGAAAA